MKTWHLENVREIAKQAPYTFWAVSNELIKQLQVGHLVKLIFINDDSCDTDKVNGERMWVKITHIDGNHFIGQLDNQPYEIQHLNEGDEIHFNDYHIMDFYEEFNQIIAPVPALDNYWDKCWTTRNILNENTPIGFIYRTEPIEDNDSFIDLLSTDIGKAFAKNEQGEWVEEEFTIDDE